MHEVQDSAGHQARGGRVIIAGVQQKHLHAMCSRLAWLRSPLQPAASTRIEVGIPDGYSFMTASYFRILAWCHFSAYGALAVQWQYDMHCICVF
jgi:hypothetical protein